MFPTAAPKAGGAKGGINCDPHSLSEKDLFEITIRFVEQMKEIIGPTIDIPAPDVNTNARVMGWIMHEYSKYAGFSPGVVTGKPLDLFGSEGREAATGRGGRRQPVGASWMFWPKLSTNRVKALTTLP